MQVLNLLVAPEPDRLDWIHAAGVLNLIQRLLDVDLDQDQDPHPGGSPPSSAASPLPPSVEDSEDRSPSSPVCGPEARAGQPSEHQGLKYQVGVEIGRARVTLCSSPSFTVCDLQCDINPKPCHIESIPAYSPIDEPFSPLSPDQSARLLSQLALRNRAARSLAASEPWQQWLSDASASADTDLRLANHATKTLLHLRCDEP